jgi:hypothetical protein
MKKFKDFLNEAKSYILANTFVVDAPFKKRDEVKAAEKFELKQQPIAVLQIDGDMGEYNGHIEIKFTSKLYPRLVYRYVANSQDSIVDIHDIHSYDVVDMGKFHGSTGTLIGDLLLCYKEHIKDRV